MNIKCLLGFHSWEDCKCSNCDKTRNVGHDWSWDCQKCFQCGLTRETEHSWKRDGQCLNCLKTLDDFLEDKLEFKQFYSSFANSLKEAIELASNSRALFLSTPTDRKAMQTFLEYLSLRRSEMDSILDRASYNFQRQNVSEKSGILENSSPKTSEFLNCGGCAKTFVIGKDAVAVSMEFAMRQGKGTVIFSDGQAPNREDLVSSLDDVSMDKRQAALERAKPSWQFIQNSLARGESRTWRCAACNKANPYPICK